MAPPPPPPPAEPPKPACELTFDNLADRTFVMAIPGEGGTKEEDSSARARFYMKDDKLKVKYNAKAPTAMYDYTCIKSEKELTCWQDNPDPADYCRALIANKGTEEACTAEEIVKLTGLKIEDAKKGVDTVRPHIKKMNENDWAALKATYNNPNTQLRGILHITVNKDCNLTLVDRYETYAHDARREMENIVGAAHFVETKQDFMFEHCSDAENLVALESPDAWPAPGTSVREGTTGTAVSFRYVGKEDMKPKPGCTYTMDTWAGGSPVNKGKAVEKDAKGRLDWSFSQVFQKKGPNFVHMVRHRTCGNAPEVTTVHCQGIRAK